VLIRGPDPPPGPLTRGDGSILRRVEFVIHVSLFFDFLFLEWPSPGLAQGDRTRKNVGPFVRLFVSSSNLFIFLSGCFVVLSSVVRRLFTGILQRCYDTRVIGRPQAGWRPFRRSVADNVLIDNVKAAAGKNVIDPRRKCGNGIDD
jgi:hypothetical protein